MSYQVVGVLGRGGSALVELAVDGQGRPVATKRVALTGSAAQMAEGRRRLRREAEILSALRHPAIVPVLDLIEDGPDLVLVFPAMAENLEDRVTRLGPRPSGEVVRMGAVLLDALVAAHRAGVVHRDIKPANVLFDQEGRPALADFGVAVTTELTAGLTAAGSVVGTPTWMAPEQARGETAGPASDVFSLAATLCYAATGRTPYLPGPAATVLARAARGDVQPVPAQIPQPLRGWLRAMLAAEPGRRPSAAAILGGPAGTCSSPPSPLWSRRRPPLRRPSSQLAVGALAAVVVATAGAVLATTAPGLAIGSGNRAGPAGSAAPPMAEQGAPGGAACRPAAYQSCGDLLPAPHTDGRVCQPGWFDLDGSAGNGCESRSDYSAGTELRPGAPVRANLVPQATTDTYTATVAGSSFDLCWGALHVTLSAPPQTAEELTVWRGHTQIARALSTDGVPATATVDKPSCFGADHETLTLRVAVKAATGAGSAQDFTLTRDQGW